MYCSEEGREDKKLEATLLEVAQCSYAIAFVDCLFINMLCRVQTRNKYKNCGEKKER